VSALARSAEHGGTFLDVVDAVLVEAEQAYREGYDYAVMGLRESRLKLIKRTFGAEQFTIIDTDGSQQRIDYPGATDKDLIIPGIIDVKIFLIGVQKHTHQMVHDSVGTTAEFYEHIAHNIELLIASR
jgi:hypothetical protein